MIWNTNFDYCFYWLDCLSALQEVAGLIEIVLLGRVNTWWSRYTAQFVLHSDCFLAFF